MTTTLLPKQRLKDYCRRKQYSPPMYILTDEEKIDLHKHYTIQVTINGLVTAEGRGLSRRIAEFKAAMHAIALIGQSDPSVFDNHGSHKFGRSGIGRSFSVDHISRSQRTDSIPSMMSLGMGPIQFSSAAPSIDGIDSITENGDSLYGSETTNGFDGRKEEFATLTKANLNGVEEEEASSDSLDEGVYVESSESSSSPSVSSPTSSAASRAASVVEQDQTNRAVNHVEPQSSTGSTTTSPVSQSEPPVQKQKPKRSFLSSFFLLSSLRAISRRSMRRKSNSSRNPSSTKAEFSFEDSTPSQPAQSRPTSSSSSASYSSSNSSSAFSSNSSISSSQQSSSTSTNSSTSGSFTLPDESGRVEPDGPLVNGYSNLITESIIEEEEEEENEQQQSGQVDKFRKESCDSSHSAKLCNGGHKHAEDKFGVSHTMPRSVTSSYVLSSMCPHNHFSIYGPVLCSNALAQKNQTIEATPSAALLRYCVRMYLPLPYYDIRFDHKFYVTCRVLMTTSKGDKDKLPVVLPEQYKDQEFTARGNGETLRSARNMAAQTIIEKLRKANIYHE